MGIVPLGVMLHVIPRAKITKTKIQSSGIAARPQLADEAGDGGVCAAPVPADPPSPPKQTSQSGGHEEGLGDEK